jgi:glycerophosphoryl diester phosphodiesterase
MALTPLQIKPPLFAHRGASAYAPENTLAAFKKAKELGAAWVEFDVMLTADEEVVVFHDSRVERTTNGQGSVCELSYRYLKTLDAGSWFNPQFAQEKILHLNEVLLFLGQNALFANIELKAPPGREQATVQKVLAVVESAWPKQLVPPLLSSFSIEILRELRRYATAYPLAMLLEDFSPGWEVLASELACASINIKQEILNPERIKRLKAAALPIFAYTVNEPQRAAALFSWGVDAVFTDCPDKVLSAALRKP